MDTSSPPPTGLAFWTLPIAAGLCSSDFQERQRLDHDPPSLAALSLGADTQAQLQLFESHLADLALVSAASDIPLQLRPVFDFDYRVQSSLSGLPLPE